MGNRVWDQVVTLNVEFMERLHQAPVRFCEDSLPWPGQERGTVGDAVCTVESVDGPPTFTEQCRRGAPVMWGIAAARCSQRLKRQE